VNPQRNGPEPIYTHPGVSGEGRCGRLTGKAQLSPRLYVMRHITSQPARSGLIVAGVAIAVAFFVLFASMSAGLNRFIDEELDRQRTTHIYLDSGSPTPFSVSELNMIALVVESSEEETGVGHHIGARIRLPVSTRSFDIPLTMWGIGPPDLSGVSTPPYDEEAKMSAGRHLGEYDWSNYSTVIPVVLGHVFAEALLPDPDTDLGEQVFVQIAPFPDVDPWWMPDASEYPLEAGTSHLAIARGPIDCQVVGILEPGQGDDLDGGAFVALAPVMRLLGQYDEEREVYWTHEITVTIDDASRVDVQDLEGALVETVPGIQGTDDHWDPEEFKDSYGGALAALDGWLFIVTAVLVVMLVAGVSDTTLVAVTERKREIATLRAVGIPRRRVSRLVLTEVAVLVGAGLLLGLVIGSTMALAFGALYESTGGSGVFLAPTSLDPVVLAAAAVLALGSAVLAAAYPAMRAGGQRPTEALRYE
jgi:hypothetical protein